ncbi:MAG: hypothetical protein R3F14_09685 [Polyangiaceae bacterium]
MMKMMPISTIRGSTPTIQSATFVGRVARLVEVDDALTGLERDAEDGAAAPARHRRLAVLLHRRLSAHRRAVALLLLLRGIHAGLAVTLLRRLPARSLALLRGRP